MNNQGNKAAWKESEKSAENKLKDMEILNGREFKIVVLKIFNEMWKNTDRQCSKFRKQQKNEYITKEIETLKKNQTEILEMKNLIREIKKDQE